MFHRIEPSIQNKVSIKRFIAVCVLMGLLIVGVFATFILVSTYLQQHETPNVFIFREEGGARELVDAGHNIITDIGEQYDRNVLGFNNVTNFNATKWISVGNATVSQTLTKLTTEATTGGFERALATVTSYYSGGDYGYNITITLTASSQMNIDAAGLHWSGVGNSDNNLYAARALTGGAATFTVGSKCIIIWLILRNDN